MRLLEQQQLGVAGHAPRERRRGPGQAAGDGAVEGVHADRVGAAHAGGEGGKKGFGAYDDVIKRGLEEVDLPEHFAEVANTNDADDLLRGFHAKAIEAVGDDVGTPVVALNGTAFFGPVITRVPEGEEAGKLFDHAVGLAEFPYFFELKRTRTEMPQVR